MRIERKFNGLLACAWQSQLNLQRSMAPKCSGSNEVFLSCLLPLISTLVPLSIPTKVINVCMNMSSFSF
jgi:hypothetical protein